MGKLGNSRIRSNYVKHHVEDVSGFLPASRHRASWFLHGNCVTTPQSFDPGQMRRQRQMSRVWTAEDGRGLDDRRYRTSWSVEGGRSASPRQGRGTSRGLDSPWSTSSLIGGCQAHSDMVHRIMNRTKGARLVFDGQSRVEEAKLLVRP